MILLLDDAPSATRAARRLATCKNPPVPIRVRLVLASALMLFLELALIRWLGANVLHLSYFSNIVLLGSFLGVGVGFLRAGRTRRLPLYFPIVLAVLVVLVRTV